jgi:radical SAM protein with 4Fe4S-binding SPASM domain
MSDQFISAADIPGKAKPKVQYLHIDVTVICNLKCSYCYYGDFNNKISETKEVGFPELKIAIKDAKALGCTRVIFSGGEVYTSPKFEPLLFFCADNELEITIITNGTMVAPSNLANLLRLRKYIHEIKVSFDGLNHDKIRGKGNGRKTLDFIEELDSCRLPWTLNTIITTLNIRGLSELYDFISSKNPKAWRIDHPFSQGRYTKTKNKLQVNSLEFVFLKLSNILRQYLDSKPTFELWMFTIYRPGLENWLFTKQDLHMHPCTYNKRNISIRGNGEITPCSRFLHPLGNIKETALSTVRHEKDFADFWNIRIGDLPNCSQCRYLYACGGGCRAHSYYERGDIMASDPIACEIMPLFEQYILPMFSDVTRESFYKLIADALLDGRAGRPSDWQDKKTIYAQLLDE